MNSRRRAGFTLIEVLIVVVIMAILAGAIIPRMSTSTTDAKESLLRDHLRTMRMQIEIYKAQHLGKVPSNLSTQLLWPTDANGVPPFVLSRVPDAEHPYGPYLSKIPAQPFSDNSTVRSVGSTPVGTAAPGAGWMYRFTTGQIWADHAGYSSW